MSVFVNVSSNSPATAIADLPQLMYDDRENTKMDHRHREFLTYIKSNRETFLGHLVQYNTIS